MSCERTGDRTRRCACAFIVASTLAGSVAAEAQEGRRCPPVALEEAFTRDLIPGPRAGAPARENFAGLPTQAQLEAEPHPRFAIFARGDGSRRPIMAGLDDQTFRTLFRARAVPARTTCGLRASPFFREQGLEATAAFFDVLQLLDFESLTPSDGATWSHRINFE